MRLDLVFRRFVRRGGEIEHRDAVVPLGTIAREHEGDRMCFRIERGGRCYPSWRDAAAELEDRVQPMEPDWSREGFA